MNVTATNKNEQTEESADLTNMPADPRSGLLATRRGDIDTAAYATVAQRNAASRRIYGHDLFTNKALTFEPNLSLN